MEDSMITDEVRAGVALLDAKVPGWEFRVDVPDLNMGHPRYCVVGQLFGAPPLGRFSYEYGIETLGLDMGTTAYVHGFNACPYPEDDCAAIMRPSRSRDEHVARLHVSYENLTEQWTHVVRTRLGS